MISYNITTGDTLTKVLQRIPGGLQNMVQVSQTHFKSYIDHKHMTWDKTNKLETNSSFHVPPCAAVGPGHILAERHFAILLTTIVFTLPLSLYRNIERLGKVRCIMVWQVAAGSHPLKTQRCVSPGVLPVNGADLLHPHCCGHQSGNTWTTNV